MIRTNLKEPVVAVAVEAEEAVHCTHCPMALPAAEVVVAVAVQGGWGDMQIPNLVEGVDSVMVAVVLASVVQTVALVVAVNCFVF